MSGSPSAAAAATQPAAGQDADASPAQPPIEISSANLYAAYKANEVAADGQYKGRVLKVSGVVASIGKDIMDDPYVTLVAENEYQTVNAYFSKDHIDELSKLHKGDSITVTCKGNGMLIGSPVLDCKG